MCLNFQRRCYLKISERRQFSDQLLRSTCHAGLNIKWTLQTIVQCHMIGSEQKEPGELSTFDALNSSMGGSSLLPGVMNLDDSIDQSWFDEMLDSHRTLEDDRPFYPLDKMP
jgi:hypothetical protein